MTIFISGLNFKARKEDLIDLFTPYGKVDAARIIVNHETHRSRGYGFVEMSNEDEAKAAIAALNGAEHMGRTIAVSVGTEREPR